MEPSTLKQKCFNVSKETKSLVKKAEELYFKHNFKQAKTIISKIISEPNTLILDLQARIEFELGHRKEAFLIIDRAISLAPDDRLHATKGLFYRVLNCYQEALKEFEESLKLKSFDNQSIIHIAEMLMEQLKINDAYLLLRKEKDNLPSYSQRWKFNFNQCLGRIDSFDDIPLLGLYTDLIEFFNDENSSLSTIGKLCCNLIIVMRDMLNIPLAKNQLLLSCLSNGIITYCDLEIALIKERKRILQTSLSQLNIEKDDLPLASALVINAYYNEYIVYYDQDEKQLIQQLKDIIQGLVKKHVSATNLSAYVLLYIMYEPINTLELNDYIETNNSGEWSDILKNIIQWSIINPLIENELKANLQQLDVNLAHNDANTISSAVQQQYEENPYPRWIKLQYPTIALSYINCSNTLIANAQHISFLKLPNLQLLVAGCGTGEHPLSLAKIVPEADITAIDISKASLAYAQRMANEYKISTVNFLQADILNLGILNKTFHIIETVGVLHHMENPESGLKVLRQLMKPEGIIKIGLYSTLARKEIIKLRQLNQSVNMAPTKENIKSFRHAVLCNPDSEFHMFTTFMDFFSTSSCRDLLFHEQEHTYTIPQLQILFNKYRLRFLGFSLQPQYIEHYKSLYPDDPSALNLDNWHVYEQKHQKTFRSMYQFYCQAID